MRTFIKKLLVVTTMVVLPLMSVLADNPCSNGLLLNHDTNECSEYIDCGVGDYADFDYNNNYEYRCASAGYSSGYKPCAPGYYCPGVKPSTGEKYTWADRVDVYGNGSRYIVGVEKCPTDTYSLSAATSIDDCKTCPSGMTVNSVQTGCVCGEGYILHRENDNPTTWECVDETQISCQTLESYTVPVANGQHEHPKGFAILRASNGFVSVMNNGHYEFFHCWPCPRGYKCDGTPESWLNARNINNFTGVGAVQCEGNTYTFYDGQSECLTCPSGSSVDTTTHATCICDDTNAVFDGTDCVSAIHADPGYYVRFTNNNGVINNRIADCEFGHYCPGGDFAYADADENGRAGLELCPSNTYYFGYNATSVESCIECPANSTVSSDTGGYDAGAFCDCDNDLIFDMVTNECVAGVSIEPGEQAYVYRKHILWNENCDRGYYCPGTNPNNPNGYWTSDDIIYINSWSYIGIIQCGDNQYSNSGSTSASDCKYCPTDNHGTGILSWNGSTPLCGCEDGFKWSRDLETCISASCPNSALNYAAYGSDNGALISFGAESYNDDCLGVWGVIDDARNLSIDNPAQIVAAGTSVMLCKQTQEGYYLGPCTRAVRMCDLQDFGTMYSAMTNGTLTAFIQTALGVSNYNDLFSNSRVINPSNGAANQTNLDVEGDEPGERCNPTTPYVCESGKYLNVLNENVCTYSTKPTTPALPVTSGGNTYWLMMSPVSEHDYPVVSGSENKLHIIIDNTTYSVYDGSVVSE